MKPASYTEGGLIALHGWAARWSTAAVIAATRDEETMSSGL